LLNLIGQLGFTIGGATIVLLLAWRARGLLPRERNAVATAVFGLFLCGRYSAVIENDSGRAVFDWVFTSGVAGLMILLAFNNLWPNRSDVIERD